MTLQQIYDQHYAAWAPDLSERTIERYRFDLQRWQLLMGDLDVSAVTTATYQEFRRKSKDAGHTAQTTETTMKTIRQIVRVAHVHGLLEGAPPDRGKPRPIPPPQPFVPTMAQLNALYLATDDVRLTWPRLHVPPATFWKCLMAIGVWTALRKSDLLYNLRWANVTEERITFSATKTQIQHSFPLVPTIQRHLAAMYQAGRVQVLGPTRNNSKLQENLDRLSMAAGIEPHIRFQHFRRFAVTNWSRADSTAGTIVHGSGLGILAHYIGQFDILKNAAGKVELPPAMEAFKPRMRLGA